MTERASLVDGKSGLEIDAGSPEATSKTSKRGFQKKGSPQKSVDVKGESSKAASDKKEVKSSNKLVGQKKQEPEYKSNTGLSKRGVQALLPTKDEKETKLTQVSFNDAYDAQTNPNGYLNMLVEENHLMLTILKEKLQEVCKTEEIPDSVFESQDW
jgi:hypothetical protein